VFGTAPYTFRTLRATTHGRLTWERAVAEFQQRSIDSLAMPVRLRRPRPEVESIIDRVMEQGSELQAVAEGVHDRASFKKWVRDTERWHALGRDALITSYETDEPATENASFVSLAKQTTKS
jgi:hypothetical protein